MRALTLNLFRHDGGWPARREVLRAGLARLRPDVVALQEAIVDGRYDQAAELLGDGYHLAHQTVGLLGDGRHHGASVASRWPILVGGDFNATPDASSMRFWTGRTSLDGTSTAYRDCWESVNGNDPGWTFDPGNPLTAVDEPGLDRGRRIDYLLVRCGDHLPTLRVADCRLALEEPVGGVMASDHYGVVADLQAGDQGRR